MNIIFRCDASIEIGTGHVMRCLTLADALRDEGAECVFICRAHAGNLIGLIQKKAYQVHILQALEQPFIDAASDLNHAAWLSCSQEQDADDCQAILKGQVFDWLVVDHYALDRRWQAKLKPFYHKLLVIDDLADREHLANILLDQTLGRDKEDYYALVPNNCMLLCGTDYALLRPEFAKWREYSLARRKHPQLQTLLINLGGIDKDNLTCDILYAIKQSDLPKTLNIIVVMGKTAPWIGKVQLLAQSLAQNTQVLVDVDNMAELMANSDLAIGAAGSTSWERCCLGLPTIMLVIAENQRFAAEQLKQKAIALIIDKSEAAVGALQLMLDYFSSGEITTMTDNAARLIDGMGSRKLSRYLMTTEGR